jgi:hypothetical protein
MTYTRNYVYTQVNKAVTEAFPTANVTGRYSAEPAKFPNVYIYELDYRPTIMAKQLKADDIQWESTFEVQISSNKTSGAMNEAYAIMDVVRTAFSEMYYRQIEQVPMDETTKYHIVGQFRRVVGGGDVAPTI